MRRDGDGAEIPVRRPDLRLARGGISRRNDPGLDRRTRRVHRPAPDVDKIARFARFFEKILAATTDAKRESGATPGQDELDGIARTSATQMDPVALIDHATGLPTRLVGSVASTSYYWVCELSNEEMKRAFADTNSYLRRVVADGRILEHAPTNLVVFLARQKQGLDDAESWSRGPPKGGKRDK